jgi:hypothetical protein
MPELVAILGMEERKPGRGCGPRRACGEAGGQACRGLAAASLLLMAVARVKVPDSWGQAFGSTAPSGGGGVGAATDDKDLFFFLPSSTATTSSCWWPWLPCPQLFPSRLGVARGMGCCVEAGARARVWDEKGKATWMR